MTKILLVEDEDLIRDLLELKLQEEGYDVITAENGEEGLERILKERPDIVILDIVMPKMTGFEVLKALQERKISLPVIVISNSGQPVELEEAKRMGAVDWLIKTEFDPQEVLEKVKKYVDARHLS